MTIVSPQQSAKRLLTLSLFVTAAIAAVEVAGGLLSNSISLIGDAVHVLMDVMAIGVSLFAITMAARSHSGLMTYGYHRAEVLAALRQLSRDQREVLLLRTAAGLTAPEVAAIVGKTTGAVKALRHRGVASLARVLGVTNDTSAPEPLAGSSEPASLTSRVEGG